MDFPAKFIDSFIKCLEYNEKNKDQQYDFTIAPYLFEESKPRIVVKFRLVNLLKKEYLHLGKSLTISIMTVLI